jgi:hypothetical protein
MAFPKQHVLGVHIRVPKGQFKKVRKELLARVHPLPGERAETLAKRAKAESRDMGLQVSPDSDEILVLTPSDSEGSPGPAPVHRQGQQNLRQPAPSSQPPPAIGGERLAIQRNVASAIVSLYDARRRSAPRLRSQPRPAIGGTQADQHMEISAIGEECLAEQGPAHRTLALPGVSCHRESSGAATDSDGSMASGLAPWVDHNEQGFRFRPTEELGKGSFGKVFGGILEPIGQAVALKLLSRNPVRGEEDAFAHKEIEALRALMHPCIVRLVGYTFTMFNVQLYLQRHETTLHRYLAQGPSEAQAAQIATSILKGLAHMHATGYVHRDLKSNNILVDSQPLAAVIADLGSVGFGENSCDVVTTLLVRAPEIMCGHPFCKASDIWSLGCILAQTEQRDFLDAWTLATLEKHRQAAEFVYMWGLAKKLCPKGFSKSKDSGSKYVGLGYGVLRLGQPEVGVWKRFRQPIFHQFMGKLLNFQTTGRETAENLLKHPWLQTQGACQPLAAAL